MHLLNIHNKNYFIIQPPYFNNLSLKSAKPEAFSQFKIPINSSFSICIIQSFPSIFHLYKFCYLQSLTFHPNPKFVHVLTSSSQVNIYSLKISFFMTSFTLFQNIYFYFICKMFNHICTLLFIFFFRIWHHPFNHLFICHIPLISTPRNVTLNYLPNFFILPLTNISSLSFPNSSSSPHFFVNL